MREKMELDVYICPTPGCPEYYGVAGMGDLHKSFVGPKVENRGALKDSSGHADKHSRAACPTCRMNGVEVERQRVTVTVFRPEIRTLTPALP